MNTQHLKDSLFDLWTDCIKPASITTGCWLRDTFNTGRKWFVANVTTPHAVGKALEIVERSLDSLVIGSIILWEAVWGTRPKNYRYGSPWQDFYWTDPPQLYIFGWTVKQPPDPWYSMTDCGTPDTRMFDKEKHGQDPF